MRAVFGLVLIVGMALAGFAIYMVQGYFEQQNAALHAQRAAMAQMVPTVDVYAVTRDMEYGEAITAEDVRVIPYPEPFLPEGVFRTQEELFPNGLELTRVVVSDLQANEPLLANKVTEPGENAGINSRLTPGTTAFAIRVDVRSAVSGFLRPGDYVNVYWTGDTSFNGLGGSGGIVTKQIVAGLKIVAVDQNADSGRSGASDRVRTVTVEATDAQVAALATAQGSGELALALVGRNDSAVASSIEVDQASLLGIQAPAAPEVVEQEEVCTTRVRRGAEVVEIPIPCTN